MRLLSYNIHKGIGGRDRRYRLERIISVIESENPDIVCLHEVDRNVKRSRFNNQPRILADYFNMRESLFQLNVKLKTGGYGNMILSRWPFLIQHQISLTNKWRKSRGAQLVVIDSPEGAFQLVNFHLGLAEKERHWQIDHLLTHRLFEEGNGYPALIVGDTNDWRNTLAKGTFSQHQFEEVTHPPSKFRSFPAYLPVGTLDKAFIRGEIGVKNARLSRSKLSREASDHLPLVIDFHLNEHAELYKKKAGH
ncbi:endonuclease/exonuclease/phosphatase family protein [uncultured Gimesia sp.]|uniref:endonuclease/exonuclease/phosphatase family protein n=1 Tax=uncultured Gimesia sp. TaxID=1678688 RepID=UPI002620E47F|nr:endonuclease/exonuclease/phosphatase family protein [uncultured Gimesia sp.]